MSNLQNRLTSVSATTARYTQHMKYAYNNDRIALLAQLSLA